jgi:hypothetical protein
MTAVPSRSSFDSLTGLNPAGGRADAEPHAPGEALSRLSGRTMGLDPGRWVAEPGSEVFGGVLDG